VKGEMFGGNGNERRPVGLMETVFVMGWVPGG